MKVIKSHIVKLVDPLRIMFIIRIFLLLLLCILPSYEIVKIRFCETVTTAEEEISLLELSEGDVVRQNVFLAEGTHLQELSIGMTSYFPENDGVYVTVMIAQGEIIQSEKILGADIPADGFYKMKQIDFSKYSGGNLSVEIVPKQLANGSFALKTAPEIIYGCDAVQKNGMEQENVLAVSYVSHSWQKEGAIYSIGWILIIVALVIFVSWLMTYQTEWRHFDRAVQLAVFGLIIAVFSLLYPSFLWYGCDWCEGIFYYQKIQENSLKDILLSSDFNLYMAQYNNIFMYLIVKVFGIDTYTFVVCQVLSIGMVAYWASCFCKKQYGKYFPIDLRVGAAIVSICYLYTMQEFSFIGIAYFGVLLLLYIITYDFSEDRLAFWLVIPMIIVICLSKMTFVIFCPIGIFLLFLWRKKVSGRNRILLWVMSISCMSEAVVSILLNGGLSGGDALGTIQNISFLQLLSGSFYYMVQLAVSVFFHEMNLSNALLLNVLAVTILTGILFWSVREVYQKGRFEKAAGFLIAMLAVVYENCALQLLTNSYSLTPENVHWDKIFYVPVVDKWWWYAFGYVALWAIELTGLYIAAVFCRENILQKNVLRQSRYQLSCVIASLLICIFAVNQYAYHGEDLQSYKTANMFTIPEMMQGNFTEYSFMQKDDKFLILTSFKPDGLDWFYIHNAEFFYADLEERCQKLEFGEGGLGINGKIGIPSLYVHKDRFTNQMKDGKYCIRLYRADDTEIGYFNQLDTDVHREYICFYFDGKVIDDISYVTFEYEDGTPAYIDYCVRMGVCSE